MGLWSGAPAGPHRGDLKGRSSRLFLLHWLCSIPIPLGLHSLLCVTGPGMSTLGGGVLGAPRGQPWACSDFTGVISFSLPDSGVPSPGGTPPSCCLECSLSSSPTQLSHFRTQGPPSTSANSQHHIWVTLEHGGCSRLNCVPTPFS